MCVTPGSSRAFWTSSPISRPLPCSSACLPRPALLTSNHCRSLMLLLLELPVSPAPPDSAQGVERQVRDEQRLHPAVLGDDADTEAVLQLHDLGVGAHV